MKRQPITLQRREEIFIGRYQAMASPCEILIETDDAPLAQHLLDLAAQETWRIESKFSRYQPGNIIDRINHAQGVTIKVDDETAKLLDFAHTCYQISDGMFDITSGILRRAWVFDGSDRIPNQKQLEPLLPLIGWHKVQWESPRLTLQAGMEIDLGGIGKEYAVDRVLKQLQEEYDLAILVNFGGDLHANRAKSGNRAWITGIDSTEASNSAAGMLELHHGALATSGDAFRYLQANGVRYSHVLNPKTGWPIVNAAHSVTVAAGNCIDAGILSTLSLLQGKDAENFLNAQDVKYWIIR